MVRGLGVDFQKGEDRVKRNLVTDEMKETMRELEAQGKTRKEIAQALGLEPPTITRHLGAVRQYRGARMPKEFAE